MIIGAGPVGLSAALTVAKHGGSVRIIDRLGAPQNDSRAAIIHTRTLELFERLGVLDPFLAEGVQIHGLRAYDQDGKTLFHATTDTLPSAHNFVLGIGQDHTERILAEELEELGVVVERGLDVKSIEQDEETVTASLIIDDEPADTLAAKYLVGADGAHSTVRHLLGIEWKGESLQTQWVTGDVKIDSDYPADEFAGIIGEAGIGVIGPLNEGRFRIIAGLNTATDVAPHPTLEEFQRMCTEVGFQGRVFDARYIGSFGLNTRLVPQMQVGRVFLTGDSAHIHSPIGGQGMNTGIGDAINLGWKLALAVKGAATAALVSSYEEERRANAQSLLRLLGPATKATASSNPIAGRVRPKAVKLIGGTSLFAKFLPIASELKVNYRRSPVVSEDHQHEWHWVKDVTKTDPEHKLEHSSDFRKGPLPGERAPEAYGLNLEDDAVMRIGELFADDPRHQVLVFAGQSPTSQRVEQLSDLVETLETQPDGLVKARLVVLPWIDTPAGAYVDTEGDAHHEYGARHECLYLIRPDSYVGYRSQPVDLEMLTTHLRTVLTTN